MRRKAGIQRRGRREDKKRNYAAVANKMQESEIKHIQTQMTLFKPKLEEFANKHKQRIREDPVFRQDFQKMCAKIGVDPLASNKGVWAQLGVSQFYTELSVQIVDVCLSTRALNGGLLEVDDLISYVKVMKGSNAVDISEDDVIRAVNKLGILRGGFRIESSGRKKYVISVPVELNQDHSLVLKLAQTNNGYVNVTLLQAQYNWEAHRALAAIEHLQKEGMCWLDDVANCCEKKSNDSVNNWWFPSVALSPLIEKRDRKGDGTEQWRVYDE